MGTDKAAQLWGGRSAIDRVAELARSVGATVLVLAVDGLGCEAPIPRKSVIA